MNTSTWHAIAFWAFAITAVLPALGVLIVRDIVRAAFLLLASLAGFAGLYFLVGADFLGVTQIVVYIGGILVLLLFGVMLTNRDPALVKRESPRQLVGAGVLTALLVAGGLLGVFLGTEWKTKAMPAPEYTAKQIGYYFMTDYLLPFEVASVLLLVALVGAATLARRQREG